MRIGIDIDGVLVDIERFMIDYGTKYCYENNISYYVEEEYDVEKAFNIPIEEADKMWKKIIEFYVTKYPIRFFAKEVIDSLKENNEIYIITARNDEELYGKMEEFTKKWLSDNEVKYDKLIFTKGSKLPYCIENGIDIMIEDSPKNIKDISSKLPVLCFNCSYNRNVEGENITRVYSWYDVLDKIR